MKGRVKTFISKTYQVSEKNGEIVRCKYDSKGNLIESSVDFTEAFWVRFKFKNNSKGDVLEKETEGLILDEKIKEKENFEYYLYDKKGNWLKSREYKNDTIKRIVERTIEYFE